MIYVVMHKIVESMNDDLYKPLLVGSYDKKTSNILRDDQGENISNLNENFCELTGLYWMWKNTKSKYIGLVHYRRYFFKKNREHSLKDIISKEDIINILNDYDVIVPKKTKLIGLTTREQFSKYHNVKDYDICKDVIKEKYPDYVEAFDTVSNRKYFYAFNMCIMNKKSFDNYCKWLFDILFEVEKRVDMSNYTDYEKRLFGFLSERLFNVWLEKNNLKLKELAVYNVDDNYFKQCVISVIKDIIVH